MMNFLKSTFYIFVMLEIVFLQLLEANKIENVIIKDSTNIRIIQSSITGISEEQVKIILKPYTRKIDYLEDKLKNSMSKKEQFELAKELRTEKLKYQSALLKIKNLEKKLKAFAPDVEVINDIKIILSEEGIEEALDYLESLDIEKVVKNRSKQSKIYLIAAKLYALVPNEKKVQEFYRKSFKASPNFKNSIDYANYLATQNQIEDAIGILRSMYNIEKLNEKEEMQYFNNLANLYNKEKRDVKAIKYYEKAFEIAEFSNSGKQSDVVNILINLGDVYTRKKDFSSAEESYKKVFKVLRSMKPRNRRIDEVIARALNVLGSFYRQKMDSKKAYRYYLQAIQLYENLSKNNSYEFRSYLADSYFNMANLYSSQRNEKEAFPYYKKAFKIYNGLLEHNRAFYSQKILACFTRLLRLQPQSEKLKRQKAHALQNMGWVYLVRKKYTNSRKMFLDAKKIYDNLNVKDAVNLSGLAYSFYKEKKYGLAKKYYEQSLGLEHQNGGDFLNYYEIVIITNSELHKELESSFVTKFKDNKELFIYYEMFKMIDNMAHHKEIKLEGWIQKYQNIKFKCNFDFKPLNGWIKYRIKSKDVKKKWDKLYIELAKKNKT